MSLLDKLFKTKAEKAVKEVLDNLMKGSGAQPGNPGKPSYPTQPAQPVRPEPVYAQPDAEPTPIGRSWGELMPNEPNQFNYPGTYREYFEDIFSKEFAAFSCARAENPLSSKVSCYSFFEGPNVVLVVELVSQGCDVYKVRRQCEQANIPYLRFYYNHDGWWNARSYVVNRMRNAMGR